MHADGTAEPHEVRAWLGPVELDTEAFAAFYRRVCSEPDEQRWLDALEDIERGDPHTGPGAAL